MVNAQAAKMSFRHQYKTEAGWDGGVLEISIAGGTFQDIIAAGGTFLQNGYNDFLTTSSGNPVTNRFGWSGNSGGYITTIVRLPAAASGQNVQLRWRMGADTNTAPAGGGWNIDTINFAGSYSCAAVPGAGLAAVGGRVLSADGRGLRNSRIRLTDSNGENRMSVTGRGGAFQFDKVPTGEKYTLMVLSRKFVYEPVELEVKEGMTGIEVTPGKASRGYPNLR
jgi:hypothetical protein